MFRGTIFAAILVVSAAASAASDGRVKIAVLDLQPRGVDAQLASSAGTLVASELDKLQVFKVISREDIRNMLSFERDRQKVGCEADQACLAEIGAALGVEYIVAGSLAKIGDSTVLSLALNDIKTANVENRVSETVAGKGDALIQAVARNAKVLVSKILKGREGYLVLQTGESGAVVKIDGAIRGTTPLHGRLTLPWGPHLLEVEKTGFVGYSEDVTIPNKQVLAKSVALVPSSDFIERYEGSAKKMRLGAWITTGVAAAGVGAAIAFNQLSSGTETKFQAAKTRWQATLSQSDYDEMSSLSRTGNTQVTLARIGLGVGAVAAGLATYFWIAGDDPHRYEGFHDAPKSAQSADTGFAIAAAPSDGGAQLGVLGRF